MTEEAVEIAITLQAGVPVAVKLADVSRGQPLGNNQRVMEDPSVINYKV